MKVAADRRAARPRRAHRAWTLALLAGLLTGCGGGSGGVPASPSPPSTPPAAPVCAPGSAAQGGLCVAFAERFVERLTTPWSEGGRALSLELIGYRPLGVGGMGGARLPAVVIHHGSTGDGSDPTLFKLSFDSQTLAREFSTRGFLVFFPQRRGRGGSDGLYDEGFRLDRSAYSCISAQALPGLLRAGEDAEVIAQGILARADVDPERVLAVGVSRGGLLALAHAAQQPARYRGVVNFVGGWLGEGCADAVSLNRGAAQAAAAGPPSLWLYGENDPFYSVAHSRANFEAFLAAGGRGEWQLLRRTEPGASGHQIHVEPALWGALLDTYLRRVLP